MKFQEHEVPPLLNVWIYEVIYEMKLASGTTDSSETTVWSESIEVIPEVRKVASCVRFTL